MRKCDNMSKNLTIGQVLKGLDLNKIAEDLGFDKETINKIKVMVLEIKEINLKLDKIQKDVEEIKDKIKIL